VLFKMISSSQLSKKIRRLVVDMTHLGKSSHVASGLSIADILAVLYSNILNVDADNPEWADRDRFVLSKGHAGAAVYAVLAEVGFFPVANLRLHYQNGSKLSGHVSHKEIPGVELSTGSLGHGLSVGTGMALAAKLDNAAWRTFVLMSDGECDEGSNWEAALFAGHHKLSNLIAIIDYNKIQSLATTEATLDLEPFAMKWESFGWAVQEIDGHSHEALKTSLSNLPFITDKPNLLIAHTTKGKGVSFMEGKVLWHYRTPQGSEYDAAILELEDDA
jgi:transketolase